VFTPAGGLGHATGQVYAALTAQPTTTAELSERLGYSAAELTARLGSLRNFRLVEHTTMGWAVSRPDGRTAAATRLGVSGRLTARALRYTLEREVWEWWCAELRWMHAATRAAPKRRPGPGQFALLELQDTSTMKPPHPAGHRDQRLWKCTTFIRHCDEYWRPTAGFPGCVVNVGAGEEACPTEKQESFRVRVSCTGGRSVSALAPALDAGFIVARIADDEVSEAPRVQRYSPNGP